MTDPAPTPAPATPQPHDFLDEPLTRAFDRITAAATTPPAQLPDEELASLTPAELAMIVNPVAPGLRLTAGDALEFGRRWRQEIVHNAYLSPHPRFAEHTFGRWTAMLLHHLGARLEDADELIDPALPVPDPHEVGRELSYSQKLSADVLGTCVCLLSDLATEFTPHAPRRVKARVVGEFAGGFATGLRQLVRENQSTLSVSLAQAHHVDTTPASASAREFHARVAEAITAVLTLEPGGRIVEANEAAQALLGRTAAQLRPHTLDQLAGCDTDSAALHRAVEQATAAPRQTVTRTEFQLPADQYAPPRWIAAILGHAHDDQRGLSVLLQDVTLLRELRHAGNVDSATGLLTAPAFADQAAKRLAGVGGTALLTVRVGAWRDLDHVLTQEMRERLLAQIHARILAVGDSGGHQVLAGHSHGDGDVLVLLSQLTDWSIVTRLVKHLADWMRDPVRVGGHRLTLHPRIGIAEIHAGDTLETVLRRTRRALRDPDRTGEPWIHAEPADDADHHHALTLLDELDHVIDDARLTLHYQPLLTPHGVLAGIRPVASWTGPTGEQRRLAEIQDLAERTGLLAAALPLMLDLVCRDVYTWARPERAPHILLDLPGRTVHDDTVLDALSAATATAGLRHGQLQLGIPATALTAVPPILSRLAELPHSGCSLALTGTYGDAAPAAALAQLPWATIGLDTATIDLLTPTDGNALLHNSLASIHALGAQALAENHATPQPGFDLHQPRQPLTAADVRSQLLHPGTRA